MIEMIQANWPLLLVAFLIGLAVAWFAFNAARRTKVHSDRRDVLDDGAAPAARNQALIDAGAKPDDPISAQPNAEPASKPEPAQAPAAAPAVPPATPMGLAGVGAVVSASVEESQRARSAEVDGGAPDAPSAGGDDLTRLKGVGPKLAGVLGDLGVSSFAQIAAWDDAEIDRIDTHLGRFQGRIRRDDWVNQARLLASGDTADYEAKFGRLD